MTFSKKKLHATFRLHKCKTEMGRHTNVHLQYTNMQRSLESLSNHPLREKQLAVAAAVMKKANTILCGDFNFDSDRNFSGIGPLENDSLKKILPHHVDVWPTLHGNDKGYTLTPKRTG